MSSKATKTNPARNKHSETRAPLNSDYNPHKIDVTKEEFSRIKEALKKEEFRKLFFDYCEEIQDPENRKLYEKELTQFEAERGVDITFINPEPGFVVKTSVDGTSKCFINIAQNEKVEKPQSRVCVNDETGGRGLSWALPMAQTPVRQDLDAHGKLCSVYDVIFHPDALHMAQRNKAFRKCVVDTALDAVEREYKVKLDRNNLKFPKMQFKGIARPTVIRKLSKNPPAEAAEPHPLDRACPEKPTAESSKPKVIPMKKTEVTNRNEFTTPKHVIKYRKGIDMSECTDEVDAKLNVTIPHDLVVEIELPLLNSTLECQLDVTEKRLFLLSDKPGAKYRLNVDLPYAVNEKEGNAKFDVDKRCLRVTLPVIRPSAMEERSMHDALMCHNVVEDSGVECELREDSNSNRGSPVEDFSDSLVEEISSTTIEASDAIAKSDAEDEKSSERSFLNSSLHYQLPDRVNCNVLDKVMSFVLHVRNVQADSIKVNQQVRSVHVKFASIGAGFYPTYYAYYVELPEDARVKIELATMEPWENNVVLNVTLSETGEKLHHYLAGLNKDDLKEYKIQDKYELRKSRKERKPSLTPPPSLSSSLDVSVERCAEGGKVEIEIKPRREPAICKDDQQMQNSKNKSIHNKKQRKKNKKRRSYSESACDDIRAYEQQQQEQQKAAMPPAKALPLESGSKSSAEEANGKLVPTTSVNVPQGGGGNGTGQQQRKQRSYSECRDSAMSSSAGSNVPPSFKGILKHYSRYEPRPSISDSFSSMEEVSSSLSNSVENGCSNCKLHFSQSFSDIPEENAMKSQECLTGSCKKTVRFSEVIKKQIFRLDSSILGQRKKNQKRRDLKQRRLQRRLSEGDSADYEDNHKPGEALMPPPCVNLNKGTSDTKADANKEQTTQAPQNGEKHNKKSKYPGTPRRAASVPHRTRLESESSSDVDGSAKNGLMFEMDDM